jgi:medium-chain acyl-[acyl-carrier-protein] hydrolase
MNSEVRKWFDFIQKRGEAKVRLICFPHFGTTSRFCQNWAKYLSEDIELIGIKLPARMTRYAIIYIKQLTSRIATFTSDELCIALRLLLFESDIF